MTFEYPALWLLGALCGFGFGFLALLARNAYPVHLSRCMAIWGTSYICLGSAYTILSLQHWVGDFTFNVLSRVLFVCCLSFELRAITVLKGQPKSTAWLIGPLVLMFSTSSWFTAVQRNITLELLLFNIIDLGMMIAITVALLRKEKGKRLGIDAGTAMAYGLLALVTLLIVIDYFRVGKYPTEYDYNLLRGMVNTIGGILAQGMLFAFFLLMVSERLNRNLKVQAMHDPLTGLYNRRAFEGIAFHEISGATRTGQPVSLLIFDVDCLKQVNDQSGHAAGDAVLRTAAGVFLRSLRDEDFLCRWGGDEFCALLPRANREQAQWVAERVLKALDELSFQFGGKTLEIAVSIGIATTDGIAKDLPMLMELADAALYRAKQGGRNRFTFAQEAVPQ